MTHHPTDPGLIAQGGSEAAETDILDRARRVLDGKATPSASLCMGLVVEVERLGVEVFDRDEQIVDRDEALHDVRQALKASRAEVERLRGALERITDSTKREGVAWLLWCANHGYLLRSDRTILTSHFGQPAEHIHPDDQAEIPGWLELADDLRAVLRGDQ